ncbi:MAG: PLDc N-terminal domain-containing protein, partial [Bacteroidetes bacterium]|nr:PLDc N-terminal domain-containing protein [Bacteroidota bacterium]
MNFALVLLVIAEIFTIAVVISSTRSAGKALAYILLIIGLPLIGIIIYFSIGVNFRKRKLYKKKLTITQEKAIELQQKLKQYLKNVIESQAGKMQNFFKLAQNNRFEFMLSANNAAELLINGEQKFPSLLQDLQLARKHIHLEYYIYEVDKIGNEI